MAPQLSIHLFRRLIVVITCFFLMNAFRQPLFAQGGFPKQMKASSSASITIKLQNTGERSWSSTDDEPVRFVIRWIDAKTNNRSRWAVKWLKETVEPGESTQLTFDLDAPARGGNFKLMCGLVRLTKETYDGKNYKPPAYNAADHRWPGEFINSTYNVTVTP